MKIGAFSVSLAVKDLMTSQAFYEKLGFSHFAGAHEQNYLIMKNGDTIIGLFQGMFENNIMTFNPGWDQSAGELDSFVDVRDIQKSLQEDGVEIINPANEETQGPENFMISDPDGNVILVDQHR